MFIATDMDLSTTCDFLLTFHSNRDFSGKSETFSTHPHVFSAPLRGFPLNVFSRLDAIQECDRMIDRGRQRVP